MNLGGGALKMSGLRVFPEIFTLVVMVQLTEKILLDGGVPPQYKTELQHKISYIKIKEKKTFVIINFAIIVAKQHT